MEVEALAGTPNWLAARRGLLTASRMADAIAVLKTGKSSESRRKLMFELLAERVTGTAVEHFVTPAMQWGVDNQAGAIERYECQTGELVGPEVFVLHPSIDWFGATPDGTVGRDGLIEVKCPTTPKYLAWLAAGEVPDEHKPQMLVQLACTRRQWVDFVAFDPRIRRGPQLWIKRYEPPAEEIEKIEAAAVAFLGELAALESAFIGGV